VVEWNVALWEVLHRERETAMRIGLISPQSLADHPLVHRGARTMVDNLAHGLRLLGHTVVVLPSSETAFVDLADMDLIHDHAGLLAGMNPGIAMLAPVPTRRMPRVVVTHHAPFTAGTRAVYEALAGGVTVVAVSHDQASRAYGVPVTAVIHHGIDTDRYRPGDERSEELVFVGPMSPASGVDHAVHIAHAAGRPLQIVADLRGRSGTDYFATMVRPHLSAADTVVDPVERLEALQHAAGLLNPIRWAQPFGLVMVEALATGTPVTASARGAASEIVKPGVTGFVCSTEQAAVESVRRLASLDRHACRADAVTRFSRARMARDHEALYHSLVQDFDVPRPRSAALPGLRRHVGA